MLQQQVGTHSKSIARASRASRAQRRPGSPAPHLIPGAEPGAERHPLTPCGVRSEKTSL